MIDIEEYEYLVQCHVRRQHYVRKRYGLCRSDLEQAGRMGLMRAAAKFRPEFNVLFQTYAVYLVRQHIAKFIAENGFPVRYTPAAYYATRDTGGVPRGVSLDIERADGVTLKDLVPARRGEGSDDGMGELIEKMLCDIDPRCADIARRRAFGDTLESIGLSYGIGRERVRQLYERALASLREHPMAEALREYAEAV